jgi:hypothetical protein
MKWLKWWVISIVIVLIVGSLAAMGAARAGSESKGPIDEVVFFDYPKGTTQNSGTIGQSGVLSPDYKYSRIHWANAAAVEYWVNPTGSGVDNTTTVVTAVQAAFATWDNADGRLGYSYQGTTTLQGGVLDGYNVVSWANISAQYPNAIAVTTIWYYRYTGQIVEVDTLMNSAVAWSYTVPNVTHDLSTPAFPNISRYTDPTNFGVSGTYDIRDIMTHEAGHWIMLDDLYSSRDAALTMYGYGSTGEISKDTIGYGDERGVEAVYGP